MKCRYLLVLLSCFTATICLSEATTTEAHAMDTTSVTTIKLQDILTTSDCHNCQRSGSSRFSIVIIIIVLVFILFTIIIGVCPPGIILLASHIKTSHHRTHNVTRNREAAESDLRFINALYSIQPSTPDQTFTPVTSNSCELQVFDLELEDDNHPTFKTKQAFDNEHNFDNTDSIIQSTIPECLPVASASFHGPNLRVEVPFLYHHLIEVDSCGHELFIEDHDITVKVPEGAVTTGERVYLEVGVTMFGPFNFTNSSQPISPILWLCFPGVNDVYDRLSLKKPIKVTLPHVLTGLTSSQLQDHCVSFSKANHFNISQDGSYTFKSIEETSLVNVSFTSNDKKSYGILETLHCCFLCIEAKKTPQLASNISYCLVRIESSVPPRSEIHFATTYFLDTCLKALGEQYPHETGFTVIRHKEFKFKHCDMEEYNAPGLKITVPEDERVYAIGMEPANAKIHPDDINFWNKDYNDLLLKHQMKMYPPRVIVTVMMKEPDTAVSIPVTFSGCENNDQLSTKLIFPLAHTTQGIEERVKEKPTTEPAAETEMNLKNAFKKLLPLAHKWESIATFLNVPKSVQNKIKIEEKAVDDCLREVLAHRIDQMDTLLTWSELADAVDPFDKSLANKLRTEVL